MPSLSDMLFGSKDKIKNRSTLSPDQMNLLNNLISSLTGGGGAFGDLFGAFDPSQAADVFQKGVSDPAMRNFQQRIMPGIQQSFADQGASSGLYNSLAGAGRDLQENLSSQLANFIFQSQQQQKGNQLSGLGLGLGTQTMQPYIQQGSSGFLPGLLSNFAGGAGVGIGSLLPSLFGGSSGSAPFGTRGANRGAGLIGFGGF